MTLIQAIVLGIVQGITEFLPVSSTAHLTLTGKLFGVVDPQHPHAWTAFIAVMQLGTLAAVVAFFLQDLWRMSTACVRDLGAVGFTTDTRRYSHEARLALFILVGTIPVGIIGVLFDDFIEGAFTKSTTVIATSLVVLALVLWVSEKVARHHRTLDQLTLRDSVVIGFAQALALIPGSSRSGTTLTAGLFLGLKRESAARFSFLLSIPAVLASGVYEMTKIDASIFQLGILNLVVATVVSAVSGYAAIAWLLRYLARRSTLVFVWYRLALGLLFLILLHFQLLDP